MEKPSGMVRRWLETLANADFDVEHRAGTRHSNADALSQAPHLTADPDTDVQDGEAMNTLFAGAVVYVTQCAPIEVTLAPYPNSTMEVPVLLNGSTRFADPYTWVLHEYGTEVVCNDIMPVSWKINGVWMCASPTVHQCMSPTRLNAIYRHDGSFTQLELLNGIGHGIFTQEQLERNRQFRISQMSGSAMVQCITNAATGDCGAAAAIESRGLGSVIPAKDMEKIINHIGSTFLQFWGFFRRSWIYLSGVFLFLTILKSLLGILMQTCVLYRRRGFRPWILWAILRRLSW